jgi:hypothetical protein
MSTLANSTITAVNNLGTSPISIIGSNASRQLITFHNPGTVDIFVFPTTVLSGGASVTLTPSLASLGGGFRIFANGGDRTIGFPAAAQAWQALAASASNNPLTIMEQTQ